MRSLVKGILVALAVVAVAGAVRAQLLASRVRWPEMKTVWQHGTMYLSSVPTDRGLRYAKTQGVKTVINLMEPSEQPRVHDGRWWQALAMALARVLPQLRPWDEAASAQALGLRYVQLPISVEHPREEVVPQVLTVVDEVGAQNLLIHCDEGGRALTIWAIYLGTAKGLSPEEALAQAEEAGLKNENLKHFILTYLGKYPAVESSGRV